MTNHCKTTLKVIVHDFEAQYDCKFFVDSPFRYLCIYSGTDFYFLLGKAQPLKIEDKISFP